MSKKEIDENIFVKSLKWIINHLNNFNIPYLITDGSAVGFWGHIRTTMDIDVLIQITLNDNFINLLNEIKDAAYIDLEFIRERILKKKMFNIIYLETGFKIDFIPLTDDKYEMVKFENKKQINFSGLKLNVISPEDLIISKLIWNNKTGGSERQMRDCESIYELNKDDLDTEYIKKWLNNKNINIPEFIIQGI